MIRRTGSYFKINEFYRIGSDLKTHRGAIPFSSSLLLISRWLPIVPSSSTSKPIPTATPSTHSNNCPLLPPANARKAAPLLPDPHITKSPIVSSKKSVSPQKSPLLYQNSIYIQARSPISPKNCLAQNLTTRKRNKLTAKSKDKLNYPTLQLTGSPSRTPTRKRSNNFQSFSTRKTTRPLNSIKLIVILWYRPIVKTLEDIFLS